MQDDQDRLLAALDRRVKGTLEDRVKVVVSDHGTIWLDGTGARVVEEGDTGIPDVTLTASEDVFRGLFDGSRNPMVTVMSGALKIDGSMGTAMRVAKVLMG